MTMLEQLLKLSSAEEFFHFLQIPYDPAVLNVARLHILRRMGDTLRNSPTAPDEKTALAHYRAHLERAYQDFVRSSPLDERVFKILKEAVRGKPAPLIAVSIPGKGQDMR
ncbi:MAG: nitrogenase stabilizing/protective protein NifW [Acidobacteriaceae bacterium]